MNNIDKFLYDMGMVFVLVFSMILWGFLWGCQWVGGFVLDYFENLKYKGDTND